MPGLLAALLATHAAQYFFRHSMFRFVAISPSSLLFKLEYTQYYPPLLHFTDRLFVKRAVV